MSSASPEPADRVDPADWRCYRHPDRESGVKCRRCERPICPDCMISAPVGFQCPSCVKGAPAVRTLRSLRRDPYVTWTLVAVNAAVYLAAGTTLEGELALFGPAVAAGEWWRLVTGGFLHANPIHVLFNMVLLFQLGTLLEPGVGRVRFALLYVVSLLGGSLGALLLSPDVRTVGASGAVYGLMGAALVLLRRQGVDVMRTGIGGLLVVNLLVTFLYPGISIGGHLGGLAAGAAAAGVLDATSGQDVAHRAAGLAGCVALGIALFASALVVANGYAT